MKLALLLAATSGFAQAQMYDLVLKGGRVVDPANGIDGVRDVAVAGGKIARIAAQIPASEARRVLEVRGHYVTPGLIDLHTHVYGYPGAISADDTALPAGTTTVVDAGGAGYRTFEDFLERVIRRSETRVLALINIAGNGMTGAASENNVADMNPEKTAAVIGQHRQHIVGIKCAHFGKPGWDAIKRAVAAGKLAGVPVMVDDKIFTNTGRTSREKLLDVMRPGDMHTHMYNDRQIELVDRFTGKVQEYAVEARRRGVLFDMGHGGGSFLWPVALSAARQGFFPDTISTDLHSSSILIQQSDMPNCMSKMMLLGMKMEDAVERATARPAKAIGRFPGLGTLGEGAVADIAVLALRGGVFAFKDAWGKKMLGTQKLECVATIRAGKLVFEGDLRQAEEPAVEIYDLLIKNGHVLDPAGQHNGRMDVAVIGGKIARVAAGLPASHARTLIEAGEYYVTPGLIDADARRADYNSLPYGVTTTVGNAASGKTKTLAAVAELLNQGMRPEQAIGWATVEPARAVGRTDVGTLREGSIANLALLAYGGGRLRCVLTVRNGRVVWDSEGLSLEDALRAGPYSNFK